MSATNRSDSPWARPADGSTPSAPIGPSAAAPVTRPGGEPIVTPNRGPAISPVAVFGAGQVTGATDPITPERHRALGWEPTVTAPLDAAAARRRTLKWFAGATGGIIAISVVVLLSLVLTGRNPFPSKEKTLPDERPILAKLCPPPSGAAAPPSAAPAVPPGPRTVDRDSGISYRALGQPWQNWGRDWETGGELGVTFRTGQYFVTEDWPGHGGYLATVLSGSVPAASNDALTLDLKCAGAQVAADVRAAYYPKPNTMTPMIDKATTLAGRPAWLTEFRLHFHDPGLTATSELVAIALIDVGKPNASILYISIPGTHDQYDYVIDQLLASVRLT
jgi:hypothetical protein